MLSSGVKVNFKLISPSQLSIFYVHLKGDTVKKRWTMFYDLLEVFP